MRTISHLVILSLLVCGSGCMSMQPLKSQVPVTEQIEIGDNVEVVDNRGLIHRFTVGKITDTDLAGPDSSGSLISIPVADAVQISAEKVDGGRTTLAVVGGLVAAPIVLLGLGTGAMMAACSAGGC